MGGWFGLEVVENVVVFVFFVEVVIRGRWLNILFIPFVRASFGKEIYLFRLSDRRLLLLPFISIQK